MTVPRRILHPSCGKPIIYRQGAPWCPVCKCWVNPESIAEDEHQRAVESLRILLPKIPPPIKRK